jgi:hypothetical protein
MCCVLPRLTQLYNLGHSTEVEDDHSISIAKKLVAFLFPSKKNDPGDMAATCPSWASGNLSAPPSLRPHRELPRESPREPPRPMVAKGQQRVDWQGLWHCWWREWGEKHRSWRWTRCFWHCFDRDLGKLKNCRVFFLERNIYFLNEGNFAD